MSTHGPRNAKVLIKRCIEVGRPVMLWSGPGIGKSELIAQIAMEQGRPVIDMRLSQMEPSDLLGLPIIDKGGDLTKWAPPSILPSATNCPNAVLFLDEINSAPPSVQAAAYQLVLNRRVGTYVLPDTVSVVCAGNRDSDKGVTYRMPTPLANRLVHIEMQVVFDDWKEWAIYNKVHADVVGFLCQHKHKLCNFDPKSPDKAFATPRSWVFVSQLISDALTAEQNTSLVAGTVGEGLAVEFAAHCKATSKLPSPESILTGKELKLADGVEPSSMYSLTLSLCYTLSEWCEKAKQGVDNLDMGIWHKYVDNFFNFMLSNFQAEMSILGARTALKDYKLPIDHRKLQNFAEFNKRYGKFLVGAG